MQKPPLNNGVSKFVKRERERDISLLLLIVVFVDTMKIIHIVG